MHAQARGARAGARARGGGHSARDREAYKACMLKLVGLEPEPGPEVVDTARCARRRRGA